MTSIESEMELETALHHLEQKGLEAAKQEQERIRCAREREGLLDALEKAASFTAEVGEFAAAWAPYWLRAAAEFKAVSPFPDPGELVEDESLAVALVLFRRAMEAPDPAEFTGKLMNALERLRPEAGSLRPDFRPRLRGIFCELARRLRESWDHDHHMAMAQGSAPAGPGLRPDQEALLCARLKDPQLTRVLVVARRIAADPREDLQPADLDLHGVPATSVRSFLRKTLQDPGRPLRYPRDMVLAYVVGKWKGPSRPRRAKAAIPKD